MKQMLSSAARVLHHKGIGGFAKAAANRAVMAAYRDVLRAGYMKKRIHDYDMYLDLNDLGISRTLLLFGSREEDHRRILGRVLKPGMTVFDIGANIGYYVLMERGLIGPQGRILAIEPSPTNIRLLQRNIEANSYTNITVRHMAASDRAGKGELLLSTMSNLNSFHASGSASQYLSGKKVEVDVATVPQLAAMFGPPDLLRMDVEGHEVEIIRGMVDAVERREIGPMILFETHRGMYTPDHDIVEPLNRLFRAGYTVPYIASSTARGASGIEALGYKHEGLFATDFEQRAIFKDISPEHLLHLLTGPGGVRTVLLGRR